MPTISRSVPLRFPCEAYRSNVYRVVVQWNLESRALPCLIESVQSIVLHARRSQLRTLTDALQIQRSHPTVTRSEKRSNEYVTSARRQSEKQMNGNLQAISMHRSACTESK